MLRGICGGMVVLTWLLLLPVTPRSTLLAAVTLESVLKGRLYEKVFTITGQAGRHRKDHHSLPRPAMACSPSTLPSC